MSKSSLVPVIRQLFVVHVAEGQVTDKRVARRLQFNLVRSVVAKGARDISSG